MAETQINLRDEERPPTQKELNCYQMPHLDALADLFRRLFTGNPHIPAGRFRIWANRRGAQDNPTLTPAWMHQYFGWRLRIGRVQLDVDLDAALLEGLRNPQWWPTPLLVTEEMTLFAGGEELGETLGSVNERSGHELVVALLRVMVTRRAIELFPGLVVTAENRVAGIWPAR